MQHPRTRFWIECALACISGALLVLTVVWADWIELVFGVDPDSGSGQLEWATVGLTVALTVIFATLARVESRRPAETSMSSTSA